MTTPLLILLLCIVGGAIGLSIIGGAWLTKEQKQK